MNAPQDLPVAKTRSSSSTTWPSRASAAFPACATRACSTQPWQTFGGRDLYEGDVAKVCRLYYGVIRDHPFTDGNKRTGAALLGASLRLCGHHFKPATTTSCGRC